VLDRVDLELGRGLTLLVGPNGSGKSTLLRLLAGVERPQRGEVRIAGHDAWRDEVAARRPLAWVPERPELSPFASLDDVVRLVCRLRDRPRTEGREALATVGLEGHRRASIRELSMGQRRRAVLAAAMIGTPTVVLCDEPLESLDADACDLLLRWLDRRLANGSTAVVATHRLEPFLERAARAVSIRDGRLEVRDPLPAEPSARAGELRRLARGRSPA
jgi:ABC-2 type transport system ATP-binding protein